MAVALDAVGPSSAGATASGNTLSWSHTNVGSGVALVVAVGVGVLGDATANCSVKLDPAGVNLTMTPLSSEVHSGGFDSGFLQLFGLPNVSSGAHTIEATTTGGVATLTGGSCSYSSADTITAFGTAQEIASAGVVANTLTLTHTGSVAGNMIFAAGVAGDTSLACTAGTIRFQRNVNTSTAAGNMGGADKSGGGSQAFTWGTTSNDAYAIAAVEILVSASFAVLRPAVVAP